MRLAGARVLVTGSSGFLGRHVVRALAEKACDAVPFGRRPPLGGIVGDVREPRALEVAAVGTDAVIHLAASPVYSSELDPVRDAAVNILGTLNVLRCARARGLFVVFASSARVYGTGLAVAAEDAPLRPRTPYGASKLAAEEYTRLYHRAYGVPTTVLRFSILFGVPLEGEPPPNVVTTLTERAVSGEPLVLFGSPDRLIDLLEVERAADAVTRALEEPSTSGETYNVGSGQSLSLGALAELILAEVGSSSPIRVEALSGAEPLPVLDIGKASRTFGLTAASPRDGIARYVRWREGHA